MKRVPADEFARHAAEYLEGSETVSIEEDGEIIGQYVPATNGHAPNGTRPRDRSQRYGDLSEAELLRELEKGISPDDLTRIRKNDEMLKAIYDKAGMTEEESDLATALRGSPSLLVNRMGYAPAGWANCPTRDVVREWARFGTAGSP